VLVFDAVDTFTRQLFFILRTCKIEDDDYVAFVLVYIDL